MRFSTLFTTLALAASLAAALPAGRLRAEDALCADPSAVCAAELSPACRRLGAGSVGVAGGTADCGGQLAAYRECLASAVERCPSAPATASGGGCSEAQADRAWEIAESRKTCGAYRAFVDACPSSPFTAFAAYEMRTLGCGDGADRAGGAAQAASQGSGAGPRGPFRDCPDCPEMIALPGGPATLGSPASEPGRNVNEGPLTEVRIRPFALSITEVTRGAFARFAAETGHDGARCYAHLGGGQFGWSDAASWRDPGYPQTDAHPAVCLSWSDAQAYIGWLNRKAPGGGYRLPSEAELEYAIRAGAATAYPWGADPNAACAFANGADLSALRQFP
ncbi:MAG: SUMF1/EgtB/PvdO family nonheme iron enzyme, partial [Pseudomonadota bacterium]